MSHPQRRLLFVLAEPGYFRMYGSVITEMTRRGWTVAVAFEKPERRGATPALPDTAGAPITSLGGSPREVSPVATALRAGVDYVRYLEPTFAQSGYLRRRAERYLPSYLRFLTKLRQVPRRVVSVIVAVSRLVERALPPKRAAIKFFDTSRPDLVFVSPLVALGAPGVNQTELVKAARARGIPVIVGVGSWDHLTSKGLVRIVPDALLVWNETQQSEAVRLHRVPASRVVITGAQVFDHWFKPISEASVRSFRQRFGLDPNRRVLLFVGSSPKMAPGDSEVIFVRRWLETIRASTDVDVRDAFVIVRPHPGNTAPWREIDLNDNFAVIHPRTYPNFPLTDEDIELFRCSLAASSAVIGVNTTAMIEAAILKRPVLTVHDRSFDHSQRQTLHFAYLEKDTGGFVIAAGSLREHLAQLEQVIRSRPDLVPGDRFVERFVRPLGLERSATPLVCNAIEAIAASNFPAAHHPLHPAPVSETTR